MRAARGPPGEGKDGARTRVRVRKAGEGETKVGEERKKGREGKEGAGGKVGGSLLWRHHVTDQQTPTLENPDEGDLCTSSYPLTDAPSPGTASA